MGREPGTQVTANAWDLTPKQAIALQKDLAGQVIREDDVGPVRFIAGVDVGFEDQGNIARAGVALLAYPGLELLESAIAREPTRFPYVPGLLSFRETPVVLAALEKLQTPPDLLLVDGHGLAHPRRFGIACHLGLLSGLPSIGVGKTLLVGEHGPVPQGRGEWAALVHKQETIGAVLRTRPGVKPIYVSIGHRIDLEAAVQWVMNCTTRYKLPETTRHAHRLASG
ncbi:MAG: deoxyribonuclease V [Chromatiales bacterium]|nr:deoxyribonuclease V [Chromatiales bacterium]